MKLLNLLTIVILFKIIAKLGLSLSWWWWLLVAVFYIIDVHSQATLESNVMTNGKNIISIGEWLSEKENKDEEEVLH